MGRFLNLKLPHFPRKSSSAVLALFWFLGLVLGVFFSTAAGNTIATLMRTAVNSHVSISGLLTAILLPFLLSAFAVYIHEPWLLIPIAFAKAFVFSYVGLGVMTSYGSAGWLVRLLLMFGDCCSMPLLFWYWTRHISGQRKALLPVTAVVLVLAFVIGSFDFCVVSPFLASVIS